MKFKEINIKNKRATYDYAISDTYTAGIVLTGTEIKSIRLGKASLADTFCYVNNGEVWVKNMYIAEYFYGTYNNHESRRDRKLLLNRKEIRDIEKNGKESGFTIVPLRLYINDRGLAKLVIGIARGKKEYDKRQRARRQTLDGPSIPEIISVAANRSASAAASRHVNISGRAKGRPQESA